MMMKHLKSTRQSVSQNDNYYTNIAFLGVDDNNCDYGVY